MSGLEDTILALVRVELDRRLAELGLGVAGERLISVADAAALVSVEPATIRAWIADGRLVEAGRVGRRIRVRASDVTAAIAANGNRPRRRRAPGPTPEELADRDVRALRGRRAARGRG